MNMLSTWEAMLDLYVTIAGIEKLPMIITILGNDVRVFALHVYLRYNALHYTEVPAVL
jgi:hypothetical protein